MVVDKNKYMSSYREKLSNSLSFDRKNYSSLLIIGFLALMIGGYGVAQSSATPDVSIGSNGIQINSGHLALGGGDIVDGSTTIWNASNGYIPKTALQNIVASDVGLGNVENENALAQDGSENVTGDLTFGQGNKLVMQNDIVIGPQDNIRIGTPGGTNSEDQSLSWEDLGSAFIGGDSENDDNEFYVRSEDGYVFMADSDGDSNGSYTCGINGDNGNWNCEGTKNWIHDLGNGSEAYYSSQESPMVRAVFEGKAHVVDTKKIKLPEHFSMTVSNTKPMLRAQVTPQGTFTKAVVMDKTDDYIVIKVGKETDVNFRITGIREGYENKDVVRPKKE